MGFSSHDICNKCAGFFGNNTYNRSMQKVILIRYDEWENDHSNETSRQTITTVAERLKVALGLSASDLNANVCIVSAEVPQAVESARLLAKGLNVASTTSLPQLYITDEAGRQPDPAEAFHGILGLERLYNREFSVVIAAVSPECIEVLLPYVMTDIFHRPAIVGEKLQLEQGQAVVLDLSKQTLRII
jgi:hypothetical protein